MRSRCGKVTSGSRIYLNVLIFITAGVIALAVFPGSSETGTVSGNAISGCVIDDTGPVAGAVVRIQNSKTAVLTDASGRFQLSTPDRKRVHLSAWKHGYYCALLKGIEAPKNGIDVKLIRYQREDNRQYEWIPPEGVKGSCGECHGTITRMSLQDAHMKAAVNPRFLTMYYGTDALGNQSPLTIYEKGQGVWLNLRTPLRPERSRPYYGPGYLLDFPNTTGNCTACHIPGASIPEDINPQNIKGADRYGIHCDFCHKIANVKLDPVTNRPKLSFPGVHSMDVRRPFTQDKDRHQLFFGTFEDVNAASGDTNLPLLKESRYCASCHFGAFWDTIVYNSYGEWLDSPYADAGSEKAKTCQECHMPSPTLYKGKKIANIAPGKGGLKRDPKTIHNHNMTVDAELLKNALTMTVSALKIGDKLEVIVNLVNDKTGHHIPTDSPLRHLILLVEARDSQGKLLDRVSGLQLPDWCGKGDRYRGYYAGLPGKTYAKILKEKWTEVYPTGAYWNHTELLSDNRLAAFAIDRSTWTFAAPSSGRADVSVKLLYRRAYIQLMEQKKWDKPDILMASKRIILQVH